MSHTCSENTLIQKSAGNLLKNELGWQVEYAYNKEVLGDNGTFGRRDYHQILLTRYFQAVLKELNPWITQAQIDEVQKKLESRLSTASMTQINEEKYFLIRDGIPITVKKPAGRTETKTAAVIDFRHPEKNHFLTIKGLKIHGDLYRRIDIVGFVNGIPLLSNDNITQRTFGGYPSVYDFKRAAEDGATVPFYYENRADKIAQMEKPEITDGILAAIEAADLDPQPARKTGAGVCKGDPHPDRRTASAFHRQGFCSALFRPLDQRQGDVRLPQKRSLCKNVQLCPRLLEGGDRLTKGETKTASRQESQELERKLQWMQETEMAVVISQEQNEVQTFKKWGLDILLHRTKMEKRELDKPLKAHTLMQAITRANRVSEGKSRPDAA